MLMNPCTEFSTFQRNVTGHYPYVHFSTSYYVGSSKLSYVNVRTYQCIYIHMRQRAYA